MTENRSTRGRGSRGRGKQVVNLVDDHSETDQDIEENSEDREREWERVLDKEVERGMPAKKEFDFGY